MTCHKMERTETARRAAALAAFLMGSTFLAGLPTAALAQTATPAEAPAAAAAEAPVVAIKAINVTGSQRL